MLKCGACRCNCEKIVSGNYSALQPFLQTFRGNVRLLTTMLAAPVLPLPQGTPPPHHRRYNVTEYEQRYSYRNTPIPPDTPPPPTILTQPSESLFLYKNNTTRPCNSAPTPPITKLEDFDNSSSSSSSSSCFSASSSSPPHSSSTSKLARKKSSTSRPCCFGCCSCPSCSSVASFFFGHCPAFTSWSTSFASHSRFLYLLLFFLESSLRSIGSITFCSNPLSGLLIFIGMLIACPHVAFIAYLTSLAGLETAIVFLHIPLEEVRSGVVTFNTFLIGIVLGILCPPTVLLTNPTIIITAISVGILSLIIWKGLNTLLPSHYEFPLLNAPFHITILLYIYSGLSSLYEPPTSPSLPPPAMDSSVANLTAPTFSTSLEIPPSMTFVEPLNWQNLFYGVLLAPGPVFGTNTLFTSSLVHLAVFLYSPILLLQCLQGSLIGTLLGSLLVNPEDYSNLYNGSWGYNPLFTTAAIGGFFVVLNFHSWLLSLAGAVITTLLYSAMVKVNQLNYI